MVKERWENGKGALVTRGAFDGLGMLQQNKRCCPPLWACGAAGSALRWHGRGHRFDPDQVHQITPSLQLFAGIGELPSASPRVRKGAETFPHPAAASTQRLLGSLRA